MPTPTPKPFLSKEEHHIVGRFKAMASPCEILIDSNDMAVAETLVKLAYNEAIRIENKFSRYRSDNVIYKINHAHGKPVTVDKEIATLLDYAAQCYVISEGMFDITSGVLRKAWHFDCSDNIPTADEIEKILPDVGWEKVDWRRPTITLPKGMEIDFGGIGKEYAVDRSCQLLREKANVNFLINFGGDLYANLADESGKFPGWTIGVEGLTNSTEKTDLKKHYQIKQGGIATSGDSRRYLLKDGIRYSHILNPRTGWPVVNCPHSITVIAETCTEAGILSTLAMLQGSDAENFLDQQQVRYWCQR